MYRVDSPQLNSLKFNFGASLIQVVDLNCKVENSKTDTSFVYVLELETPNRVPRDKTG